MSRRSMAILNIVVLTAFVLSEDVIAQCNGYAVDVISGPKCEIFGAYAFAEGIAADGSICGGYRECNQTGHPVIWSPTNEIVTEIPPSSDPGYPGAPFDLNASGDAVGHLSVPGLWPSTDRAYLFSNGQTLNLGALPGHNWSEALAISADGTVIGNSNNTAFGPLTGFIWQAGIMSSLPLPYGISSEALDISDNNKICGWMGNHAINDTHAFIYDLPTGMVLDIGTPLPGTNNARATGVSSEDAVCGWSYIPCGKSCLGRKSFIWNGGQVQDLGVLPGNVGTIALAINDSNVIVGYCFTGGTEAFVWRDGVISSLNDLVPPELNLNILIAHDINESGQIVAHAHIVGTSDDVAVRLTPIPSPIGDSDCDADVDVDDLLTVINHWADAKPKGSNALPPGDFDHDGLVELDDLAIVLDNWTF